MSGYIAIADEVVFAAWCEHIAGATVKKAAEKRGLTEPILRDRFERAGYPMRPKAHWVCPRCGREHKLTTRPCPATKVP